MAKVVKFGGSSLADANQFKKAAEIIRADKDRRYVIPSAPGKRFGEDEKVTDMLYKCYEDITAGKNPNVAFLPIEERFDGIISDLELDLSLQNEYEQIIEGFENKLGMDYAASRGEYLNGIILAAFLDFQFVDAAEAVKFKSDGSFDAKLTDELLWWVLSGYKQAVIPGFYGSMPDGAIKTFSRGGSDITGSIVSKAVKASLYENWTDVSGFLVADPRIVDNPEVISTITYRELRELSYMGATVLHEDAVFPVREAGIPINIKNTNNPADFGTMIVPEADSTERTITGIAGKKNFSVIHIEKDRMNNEIGFLRRILALFETLKINFEHIPTGIDTLSLVLDSKVFEEHPDIIERLRKVAEIEKPNIIEPFHNLALIAVVGRGMKEQRGIATRIFAALSHAKINIRTIDQGSSELNIIIGINEDDFEQAVRAIYNVCILAE
ncbi:MAG: aspartate kinase [Oscillospiraceae bacterium]|nr:aspartate kinase [Oscillospiraceae bacterium]